MADARRVAPSTTRNREPIAEVLARYVGEGARVLEIASGSGEHATFLAEKLPVAWWQPSDPDPDAIASIDAWRAELGAAHVKPAIELDVTRSRWPLDEVDVVVCVNMIHIAPWRACEALMAGAGAVLRPGGVLYLYGPFRRDGAHTAPTNEAFDVSLRATDPSWGVRDLEAVLAEAAKHDLRLEEVAPMPANNFSVVFRKAG